MKSPKWKIVFAIISALMFGVFMLGVWSMTQ